MHHSRRRQLRNCNVIRMPITAVGPERQHDIWPHSPDVGCDLADCLLRIDAIDCPVHVIEKPNLGQSQNICGGPQLRLTKSPELQRRSTASGPMPSVLSARSRQKEDLHAFTCVARERSAESQ